MNLPDSFASALTIIVLCLMASGPALCQQNYSSREVVQIFTSPERTNEQKFEYFIRKNNLLGKKALISEVSLQWPDSLHQNEITLGFNPSFSGSKVKPGHYLESSFTRMLNGLSVEALRFPPGTYANFFNWIEGTLDADAVKRVGKRSMLDSLDYQKKIQYNRLVQLKIEDFQKLAQDYNMDRFMILNLYTGSVHGNLELINMLKEKWPGPYFWEMGNELSSYEYLAEYTRSQPWSPALYARQVGPLTRMIRQKFPEDKIGYVAAELIKERNIEKKRFAKVLNSGKLWMETLQDMEKPDALICHPYLNIFPEKNWDRFVSKLSKGTSDNKKALRDLLRMRWVFSAAQEVPKAYSAEYEKKYPDVDIWVTETGLISQQNDGVVDWQHGIIRSVFNVFYLINWVKQVPQLKVYMFHVLAYGKSGFSAYYDDFSYNANTLSYYLIKESFQSSTSYQALNIRNGPTYPGEGPYKNITVQGLTGIAIQSQEGRKLFLANASGSSVRLRFPWLQGEVIYAEGRLGDPVQKGGIKTGDQIPRSNFQEGEWLMPPFSICVVRAVANDH
jgi:hypothetical protein